MTHGRIRNRLTVEADPSQIVTSVRDVGLHRVWTSTKRARYLPRAVKAGINRAARARRGMVVTSEQFVETPFENGKTYRRMHDVWAFREDITASETYREIMDALAKAGRYQHKRYVISEPSEIPGLIRSCFLDLLESMSREGYLPEAKSTHGTGGLGRAIVWSDGSLVHENGATHRLAAAKIVGLTRAFPLQIVGVHEDWLLAQGLDRNADLEGVRQAVAASKAVLSVDWSVREDFPTGKTALSGG